MPRTLVLALPGLSRALLAEMPRLAAVAGRGAALALEPVLPATTLPMQATLTTGVAPAAHGIPACGLYRRALGEVRFWEQSARLLEAPRVWAAEAAGGRRVGMLFWQLAMYDPTLAVLLTPKPVHAPGDRLLGDVYARPGDLYARLAEGGPGAGGEGLGPFDLRTYWGPLAGAGSSTWIAAATARVWETERPDLLLAYLPHLDYSGRTHGPESERHRADAAALDALAGPLVEAALDGGGRAVVLSEYSFVPVARPVAPNRALREAGCLALRTIEGGEYLVPGDARAFALVDNQVAHVYCPAAADAAAEAARLAPMLAGLEGVGRVLDRAAQAEVGLAHARSGDLVLLAEPDAHFTYYWWLEDARAPAFARTVDIHAKPGFDAAELLLAPGGRGIPLSAEGVRGSHGLVDAGSPGLGGGVYVDSAPPAWLGGRDRIRATEVAGAALAARP